MEASSRAAQESPTKDIFESLPPADENRLKRNMRASLAEGATYSLMVGMGETYVPAFVIAAGLGEINSGLISTIPLLAGAFIQLISPAMIRLLKSYRKWALACASLQAVSFIPLVIAALTGHLAPSGAFLTIAIYWAAGMAVSPAWSCWATKLFPSNFRTEFFAKRTRLTQLAALMGFLFGGALLHMRSASNDALTPFAILFALAFFFRGVSVANLLKLSHPPAPSSLKTVSISDFLMKVGRHGEGGRVLIYMLSVQLSVQIAAPYFNPFMLGRLSFSYAEYAALIAASFGAKVLCLPWLGRRAATHGPGSLLWLGGITIVPVPLLWLISSNFWYLLAVQGITGAFWAAYELATILLVLDKLSEDERLAMLTNYNLFNAITITVGSLIGAILLDAFGKDIRAYYIVFTLSSVARASTVLLLRRFTFQVPLKPPLSAVQLDFRHFLGFFHPLLGLARSIREKKIRTRKDPRRDKAA